MFNLIEVLGIVEIFLIAEAGGTQNPGAEFHMDRHNTCVSYTIVQ